MNAAPGTPIATMPIDLARSGVTTQTNGIDAIEVNAGPGSFTGLRVGASIANALSFALGIPVNGKPLGEIVEPRY